MCSRAIDGMGLISWILTRACTKMLTLGLANCLLELLAVALGNGDDSVAGNVLVAFTLRVALNPKVWARADAHAQRRIASFMSSLQPRFGKAFRKRVKVSHILYCLEEYTHSTEILVDLIDSITGDDPTSSEIRAILGHVHRFPRTRATTLLLKLVDSKLHAEASSNHMAKLLEAKGGVDTLLGIGFVDALNLTPQRCPRRSSLAMVLDYSTLPTCPEFPT